MKYFLLLVAVFIGLGLNVSQGWNCDFWIDEQFTILTCIGEMLFGLDTGTPFNNEYDSSSFWNNNFNLIDLYDLSCKTDNGNMLFYNLLMYYLIKAVGTAQPYFLTVVSFVSYVVTIIWSYRIGKLFFNKNTGMVAAAITAIHPEIISLSIEVRSYMLGIAFSMIATELFFRIVNDTGNSGFGLVLDSLLYGLVSLLMIFTHFLTVLVLIIHIVFSIVYLRRVRSWIYLSAAGLFVLISLCIWYFLLGGYEASRGYVTVSKFSFWVADNEKDRFVSHKSLYNIFATTIHDICLLFGIHTQVLPFPIRYYIPLVLLVLGCILTTFKVNRKIGNPVAKDSLVFMSLLASISLINALIRVQISGSMFGLVYTYQRFSIVFLIQLFAVCLTLCYSYAGTRKTLYTIAVSSLSVILLSFYVVENYNSVTQKKVNIPLTIANEIKHAGEENIESIIVPSFLDAQLISLYLGPNSHVKIIIPQNRELQAKYSELQQKTGLEHPVIRNYFALKESVTPQFSIKIQRRK